MTSNTAPGLATDYEPAWRELHGHLAWMQGHPALRQYLGLNLADVANRLIDRAYPGLRDGGPLVEPNPSPPPVAGDDQVERLREALAASLAKRSQPIMDPPWSAAFNAALDMVARDIGVAAATLPPAASIPASDGDAEVRQEDREAALALRLYTTSLIPGDYRYESTCADYRSGRRDERQDVQAFTHHRLAAFPKAPSVAIGAGEVGCGALPDHADILETIENAADDWQKNGYTSALAEVRDMANVGRALLEALPEGYSYSNCPSEIVSDLQNELADALAPSTATPTDAPAVVVPEDYGRAYFERGFIAAYAWAATKLPATQISDAIIDRAWTIATRAWTRQIACLSPPAHPLPHLIGTGMRWRLA